MGRYNCHPWLSFAVGALRVAFGCGSQSAQMRREVSRWALSSSSSRSQPQVAAPAPGPHLVGGLEGSIDLGGSKHKGVVLTSQGSEAQKPFLSQQPCTPPPGFPSPWPSHPSCLQAESPPDKARFGPALGFEPGRAVKSLWFCHGDEL